MVDPHTGASGGVVVLGRVIGAHGVRGRVRVLVLGDGPEHLLRASRVELSFARRDPIGDAGRRAYEVRSASPAREREVLLVLEGVDDRDVAEALRGALVLADVALLAPLPPGEHYWYELVGCRVELDSGVALGTVREIWETGAHDVLVVETPAGRTHLIPAAASFLQLIDTAARRVVVAAPPGLLEEPKGAE